MPKLSKVRINESDTNQYLRELRSSFLLLESMDDIHHFLGDLMTHTERKMLAKRLQIAKLLLDGEDYDFIRERLKVTPGTIAQVSNTLANMGQGYRKVYDRLKVINSKKQKYELRRFNRLQRYVRRPLSRINY